MGLRPLRMKGCPPWVLSPPSHRTQSWWPCLPGQPWVSGWRSIDRPVPNPRGWMIGFLEQAVAHNRALLRCLFYRRCMRSWRSRGWPLSWPEANSPSPPSSLPSMAGLSGGIRTFPRWRERLRCTCAHETPPLGGTVHVSRPKPVSWRPLSRPKIIVLQARQPLPCTPWLSCWFTKPRHSNRCTRVVLTRGWCRSSAQRTATDFALRATKVTAQSLGKLMSTIVVPSSLSQESGPPRIPARPQVVQEVDESAMTWATRRCWTLLFLRRRREQRRSFPRRRAGRRILCFFVSVLSKGQRFPLSQRKSNFLFLHVLRSMGRQCATPCFLTLIHDPSCKQVQFVNMWPTCSHNSLRSPENGDSIPRRSGWSGVDSGKLRWTCLLPTSPPTASCIFPWPREDEEQVLLVAPLWPTRTWFPELIFQRLERRLSPSTLKVYVAAIAAHHNAVDGRPLGKHDLIVRFLKGARRMNPSRPPLVPSWDLSVVLAGLQRGPFESLDSVELKFLSAKTAPDRAHFHQKGCGLRNALLRKARFPVVTAKL